MTFVDIPSTLADHVRSALLWAPKLLVSIGILIAFELFIRRIEKGLSEEEIIATSSNPQKTKRFRDSPMKFMLYTAPLPVVGFILVGTIFLPALPMALCILWVGFSVWAQSHPRIVARRSLVARLSAHFLPPVLILLFSLGYFEAARLYELTKPQEVMLGPNTSESITLLRQLDKGILFKTSTGTVSFRPWSEIREVKYSEKYQPARGVLCSWFNIACLLSKTTQP